eukprot:CAMPEP_0172485232 /NCGR_PEP_ID=MMETSP1066-20121228/13171_1 /TAXON_ID=671091 /ORGANISM="Coscinodiscus wailesii, Strain CCMP2513" /LENGTH=233 /DNA_ID=CAMNT_0013250341 /DNA_START=52 /DNA_END=753 /DNA_ORIENTATION=-
MKLIIPSIALLFASTSASVVVLTPENFAEKTKGKTVFIKYFAPWCGHCQAMAEDWEKLAGEWVDNPVGLIGEVDCDNEVNDELCAAAGVQGFPTIKYGDPSALEDYSGPREYDALADFAKENLVPICSLNNLDLCDDEKKAIITKFQEMSVDDLADIIQKVDLSIQEAEDEFESKLEELQNTYEKLQRETDLKKSAAKKDADYGLVKSILLSKGGKVPDADDDDDMADDHDEF